MAELMNCPRCGKLFVKAMRPYCEVCGREIEADFQKVYTFIRKRENRQANMFEVVEGTGVERDLITQFIREGRLHLAQFPNLGYQCESCEREIREGRICHVCRDEIKGGLQAGERQKAFENRKKVREKDKYQTYHTMGDDDTRRRR